MTALPRFRVPTLAAHTRKGRATWHRGTCWFDTEHLIPERARYPLGFHPLLWKVLRDLSFPYSEMKPVEHTLVFFLGPKTHTPLLRGLDIPNKVAILFLPS